MRSVDGKPAVATVANLGDAVAAKALQQRDAGNTDRSEFTFTADGMDYIAAFSVIPVSFGNQWTAVVIAPVDDFIGGLKRINRNLAVLILSLMALEIFLIVVLAKRLTRPVRAVTQEIQRVQARLQWSSHTSVRWPWSLNNHLRSRCSTEFSSSTGA